jgi:predicted enzyme related to lactoylglutathione lyase
MGGDQMGAPGVWLEVAGRDLDALRQFYGSLFGWRIELDPAAPMSYGLVQTGAEGGIPGRQGRPRGGGGRPRPRRRLGDHHAGGG